MPSGLNSDMKINYFLRIISICIAFCVAFSGGNPAVLLIMLGNNGTVGIENSIHISTSIYC